MLIGAKEASVLTHWEGLSEFNRGMTYGILSARVSEMLKQGWARR